MTQFNEGKGYGEIWTSKIFKFENTRSDVKKCCDHWEKRKVIFCTKHVACIPNRGIYQQELPLLLACVPTVQCNVPVVENTIVDDCK